MKPGERAPEFDLPDQDGIRRTLASLLADGPLVLFFYPAASTPVCTAEACHFRDLAREFAAAGASVAGISRDAVEKQASFARAQEFDYPLLADVDGTVAQQFGVRRGLLGRITPVKRSTFVIDTDRTVLEVISSELRANLHADRALEFLRSRT
ncbi:peroxiredoxin [Prescottella equi]|uniref:thioredoxin-dependent peroxiredoxin n=2 Tax=Rhodococcus hoagii TaxID=43767 RepID=E9SZW4_RHOHA|nr:peroxiredoxin [Prescottella equi]EGD24547.1 antioxidant, AhpC/TSA family [Prescottella equi ATCC 33707]ERN45309.1 alkyl hydroperoxide reductase [Prescottella equi NBRC 101255 = C 7]MBM4589745.1 redoxin domain-containing protein [Prescottella equi]MBM4630446.1 redoxin domain-containing protein [Prescottella equi]ORL29672.1 peroxiredoxin [Prescottella equi]